MTSLHRYEFAICLSFFFFFFERASYSLFKRKEIAFWVTPSCKTGSRSFHSTARRFQTRGILRFSLTRTRTKRGIPEIMLQPIVPPCESKPKKKKNKNFSTGRFKRFSLFSERKSSLKISEIPCSEILEWVLYYVFV